MLRPSPLTLKKLFGSGIAAIVLAKYPALSNDPGRFASHSDEPLGFIASPVYALPTLSTPLGQSACVNGLPLAFNPPNTLKQTKRPVYGVPSGHTAGRRGLPATSTEEMAGLGFPAAVLRGVLVVGSALRPTHPSQKRKMPCRAALVRT